MKTRIVLLAVYVAFVALAIFQWREAKSVLTEQMRTIETFRLVAEKELAGTSTVSYQKLASAAQGEAYVGIHLAEMNRLFVLLSLALTLPLGVYVASSLSTKKAA